MATAEQYANWIVDNQDKKGTEQYNTVAQAYKDARNIPTEQAPEQSPNGVKLNLNTSQPGMGQPAPEEAGFLDNVGAALEKRYDKYGENVAGIVDDTNLLNANLSGLELARRTGGLVAGGINDVLGEGLKEAAGLLPESVKDSFKETISSVAKSGTGKSVAEIYKSFKKNNPQLDQELRDAGNMASLISPVKTMGSGAKEIGKLTDNIVDKSNNSLFNEAVPSITDLKGAAKDVYTRIDNMGARVSPSSTSNLAAKTRQRLTKEGYDPDLHPKLNTVLNRLDEAGKTPQSMSEIQVLRRLADSPSKSLDLSEARLGNIVKDSIDDFMDNISYKDITGLQKGDIGSQFKDARQLWRRAKKLEVVDEAMNKAALQASGFENGIRTQFRSILSNSKKRRGFTKSELDAMEKVVKGGKLENTAKALGKFGFTENQASSMLLSSMGSAAGFAGGGIVGGVAVPLVGQLSKNLAQKLTRGNAKGVQNIIAAGDNGLSVARAYMKSVPKNQRNAKELTELLLRPEINLKKLQDSVGPSSKTKNTLFADAVYLLGITQSRNTEESR